MFAAAAPTARDHATELAPLTQGAGAEQVEEFLRATLGGRGGAGVQALVKSNEAAGQVFGAIFALYTLSGMATVNRESCAKLASLGCDVITILDAAGRKGAAVDPTMLSALSSCFDDCCALVDSFSQPGWLLRVACNEQLREEFVTMHEAVQEILKSDNLAQLPGGRDLPMADYANLTKAVRRSLKQLGRGSITAGVAAARDPEGTAAKELAAMLEVRPAQVAAEARRVPESDLDIDTLFKSLLQAAGPSATTDSGAAGAAGSGAGGEATVDDCRELFEWYDADKSGAIELPELQRVLADLGMLEGKAPADATDCAKGHMRAADPEGKGALGIEAFARWYSTLVMGKARQQLRFKMGPRAEEDLRGAFQAFASFGAREAAPRDMDGKALIKVVRDTGLLGGGLTATDVDLTFAKVKSKGARRITFDQFLSALSNFADKKGCSFEDVVKQLLGAGGPVAHATKADAVRLHDDRSSYTGVYRRGGPTNVDDVFDLASFLDRDKSAAAAAAGAPGGTPAPAGRERGTPMSGRSPGSLAPRLSTPASSRRASMGPATPAAGSASGSARASHTGDDAGAWAPTNLEDVFASFARFGIHDKGPSASAAATPPSAGRPPAPPRRFDTSAAAPGSASKGPATPGGVQMDGFRFAKLCREAGLLDGKKLTATSVDLIFTKAKAKGAKKIGFDGFMHALQMVSEAKGVDPSEVASAVEACGGPAVGSATTPDAVRFYDDVRRTLPAGVTGRNC